MPKRRKRVLQNTKIRAAAFTCCLLFPKKRARTFPGGLAQTPSVISRCLRATRLSATVIYFFYFFSIFCAQYISVSLPTTYIHSLQHIQFGFACCQNATLSSFFVRSILILSQVVTPSSGVSRPSSYPQHSYLYAGQCLAFRLCRPHASRTFFFQSILSLSLAITLSSGVSRPYLTSSILTNSQARTSRSGLPAITSDISYLLNIQKSDTHIRLCRPASLNHQPFPQTPSVISRCLRATSFPLHFAAAFHSSNIPFFLFSFFYSFSFSLFFLSSSPFLFIFSLHFLFSRLFLSSFLFPFLLYVFLSNLFFLPFFSFSFFYHITLHVFLCAPSQRLQNRTQFCKPVQGHLPLAGFRGGAPYSFLFFLYV